MRAFAETVRLELRRLVRSRTAAMLLAASVAWMLVLPHLVRSDGTAEGARELYVHFSLGGVFALCCVALASSAAATLASERETRRLALSVVRPLPRFMVALGRSVALVAVGAVVLAVACLLLAARVGVSRHCDHVLSPLMESPREEAARMYRVFMADPETPPEVKRAKKSVVMRLLTQKAVDNYQSIATNALAAWDFAPEALSAGVPLSVRLRFTNDFDIRDDVRGEFELGDWHGTVSNITQAVIVVPLCRDAGGAAGAGGGGAAMADGPLAAPSGERPTPARLWFRNAGTGSLMLRPRKDVNLLVRADSFGWNLLRAYIQMVSVVAALVAFAMFLGAGLGRSVAVFTCVVFLFAAVVSGDVVEQYPDPLETDRIDRIGLAITRAVEFVARPVGALRPIAALSLDECVEWRETAMVFAVDCICLPLLLSLVAGFVLARRE